MAELLKDNNEVEKIRLAMAENSVPRVIGRRFPIPWFGGTVIVCLWQPCAVSTQKKLRKCGRIRQQSLESLGGDAVKMGGIYMIHYSGSRCHPWRAWTSSSLVHDHLQKGVILSNLYDV